MTAAVGNVTPRPIVWRRAEVVEVIQETSRVKTLVLDVPGWPGHRAGEHVDVRLTAPDGYQAERSYSIASPPEEKHLALTIEQLEDGEVSSYLCGVLRVSSRQPDKGDVQLATAGVHPKSSSPRLRGQPPVERGDRTA